MCACPFVVWALNTYVYVRPEEVRVGVDVILIGTTNKYRYKNSMRIVSRSGSLRVCARVCLCVCVCVRAER